MTDHRLIHPEAGDTIVLTVPSSMRTEQRAHLREQMLRQFPSNPTLILQEGITLGGNRWAALTNDELEAFLESFYQAQPRNCATACDLRSEIRAELARRKDTP